MKSIKISLIVLIVLVVAGFGFSNNVQAAGASLKNQAPSGRRTIGVVTEKNGTSFQISTRFGITLNYTITDDTKFYSLVSESYSYDLLGLGQQVAVVSTRNGDAIIANVIIQLPDDFDPQQRLGVKVRGQVVNVDYANSLVTVQSLQGSTLTLKVNELTRIKGQAESLSDIEEGNWILASGSEVGLDYPIAWVLLVAEELPPQRLPGTIESVDVPNQQFTLHFQNASLPITITSETQILGREKQTYTLEDLEPGNLAMVVAKPSESGDWIANRVFVSSLDELPQYDLKIQGRIQAIDNETIRLKNGQQSVDILVDEHTRILGQRGGGLSSLHLGMRVMVGAMQVDVDTYHAEVIVTLSR